MRDRREGSLSLPLAAGLFLILTGLAALSFGLYALLRGGRGQRGGIGPLSERGVHVVVVEVMGKRLAADGSAGRV